MSPSQAGEILRLRRIRRAHENAETDVYAWARLHMRSERRERLDFDSRPYLIALLRDRRPRQVWVACAQSGKTVTGLSKLFQFLCHPPDGRPRTVIYTFPTQTEVYQFAKARAKPMIESSPFLRTQIGDVDNSEYKSFANGSSMYFRGTITSRQATSVPADLLVHDELDQSDPDTLQMYQDRLRASLDPRTYLYSTPTIPGFGIARAWEQTDRREWTWRCGGCGSEQVFAPMDRRTSWQDMLDFETPAFRCADCHAEVRREWVTDGRWVAQAPENAGRAGYHLTGIMPPEASAERLAEAWKDAVYPERFVQGHIGLPEVSGDKSITEDMITFGDWANTLSHPGPLYAGLDQGKHLDFIAGDGAGRIVCVWRFGNGDWAQVAQAMHTLHIRMLVADLAPDAYPVQQLMKQFPRRVLGADYSLAKVTDEKWWEKKPHDPAVAIARTPGLDATREPLVMGKDGGDVFPALPERVMKGMGGCEIGELKRQLCAAVRVREKNPTTGAETARWVETTPDHMRHAHLYYRVAAASYRPLPQARSYQG